VVPVAIQRLAMQILIIFILLMAWITLYVKYFERRGIYYPTSSIEMTPYHYGLDYQEVYFSTADGLKLNAWFIKTQTSVATILFLHGNAGNISHRVEIIKMFNEAGFDVFIFDYRGYGRSQGAPTEDGLYTDAHSAYNYLVNEKNIPPERIVLYGKSIGANVAIELASKLETGMLISDSAFTSALDMGKKIFPFIPRSLLRLIASVEFDAISKIRDIKIPKLIIHSRDDEIVPFSHGERLFKEANPPKEFYPMKGSHNEAIFIYQKEFISRIKGFVKKYIVN
jgi:hypothetical protein